ncbi:sulfatase family protein [Paenibacillus aestuarii]|uniref:Sulfatase n=1 Tax=Paenibacillus aestuarii TaxID=516965 RepID=A0ABW0KFT1_9BACL|nr:sulfatase-like hydrolase/transferase [Paenibacillus aestuarii]
MKRPNILILYTDQQRWDALGVNGNSDIQTPYLDQLAKEGINFDHYFVQNPVCMPSRASFLTGQYPSALGLSEMGIPVPTNTVTLPQMLKPYGYISANIGKLHFLPHANRDHRNPHPAYGFDHLEISDEPGCYEDAYRAWVRRKARGEEEDVVSIGLPPAAKIWNDAMGIQDRVIHPDERFPKRAIPFPGPDDLTHTAFVAEQTMEFISQNMGQSWLCISGFYSPHSPWVVPRRFLDQYEPSSFIMPNFPPDLEKKRQGKPDFTDDTLRAARHGYYSMVSEVDHHIGRILSLLESKGLKNDTIVIFTSDHGEWLGEHLKYGKGFPGLDSVSRVPLIIRWGEDTQSAGRTIPDIIEAVDVLPTLLEMAGVQIPGSLQGKSLLPFFEGKVHPRRDSALTEHKGWKSLRTAENRYVLKEDGEEMLFNITEDPHEYVNVAHEFKYAQQLSDMRKLLLGRLLDRERSLPRTWVY